VVNVYLNLLMLFVNIAKNPILNSIPPLLLPYYYHHPNPYVKNVKKTSKFMVLQINVIFAFFNVHLIMQKNVDIVKSQRRDLVRGREESEKKKKKKMKRKRK
jgi:hypothetical protein